ncbi:MAG: alpha/beta fold hydrolase [Planctomycetota bacterium]|nr:alpha/beta fold hydrolase [Planctomycetota bacterium]
MKTITAAGTTFAVDDRGTGSPILFVHGFPLDHTMWEAQLESLSRTHRVIAPDLRGFGKNAVVEGTVTMEQFADDLAAILDALSVTEPVAFCGLSMGGYIGWQFFRRHLTRLSSLILIDTVAKADSEEGAAQRHKTAETVLAQGAEVMAKVMPAKLFAEGTLKHKPAIVERIKHVICSTAPSSIAAALRGMAVRSDSTPLLTDIDVPTLVICGAEDQITPPEEMRKMATAIDEAEYAEVANAGHMTPMEQPEAVTAAIRQFLANHS